MSESIIQPPPFGTLDQADEFIKSHEISSNEKFVIRNTKFHNPPDICDLSKIHIRWEFNLATGVYCDGIPYIIISEQLRNCQYGPSREDGREAEEEYVMNGIKRKRRSKKINCPAKVWIKSIMKFPEYKVDTYDGGVRSCDKKRISNKLKRDFDVDSQHFLMVFVQILNKHEHDALGDTTLEDEASVSATKTPRKQTFKTEASKDKKPHVSSNKKKIKTEDVKPKGEVLKKGATLKGKNLMKLVSQFKSAEELPLPLAQPKFSKTLDSMTDIELISLYHDITGEMPNEMFAISGKDFNMPNLWLLLHLCITSANAEFGSDLDFVVHQSIRMKGTEQIFTPVMCEAIACPSLGEHMHCPLCSSCEAYTNSSLLKKHFLQKHVLNSIEFAGLKFLRCLDGCAVEDATDSVNGHWHCWKCKSCHQRQKNCLKHFMVHLKGKEENQQIHVLQNVNTCVRAGYITHDINSVSAFNNIAYEVNTDPADAATVTDPAYSSTQLSPVKKYQLSPDKRQPYYVSDADTHALIQNEQQNAVMYLEDQSIASLLTLSQNGEVVVGYNDETNRDRLRCIIRELEQKSASLEKTNMIQKSRIQFLTDKNDELEKSMSELNMKYQDLLSQHESLQKSGTSQTTKEVNKAEPESASSSDIKRFAVGTDGTLTKDTANKNEDKNDLIKQSLNDLKTQKLKTTIKREINSTDSPKTEVPGLVDLKKHLSTIKKDIEQLKLAALLTNQQSYTTQNPMMIVNNQTAQLIQTNQQLLVDELKKNTDDSVPTTATCKGKTKSKSHHTKNTVASMIAGGQKSASKPSNSKGENKKGGKITPPKKENTVCVALKAGMSSTLSKEEIEELVNTAIKKMSTENTEDENTKAVSELKQAETTKSGLEVQNTEVPGTKITNTIITEIKQEVDP